MIRRLRVRHRRTFGVLAVLLPLGFVASLAVRPEFPVSATAPSELLATPDGTPLHVSGQIPGAPDVLVYLVPGEFAGDALPDDALLLGSCGREREFRLPDDLEGEHTLVYYSLAHGEVVLTTGL